MIEVENTDVNIVRNLIPMRNHMPASAYGLKAISDWFQSISKSTRTYLPLTKMFVSQMNVGALQESLTDLLMAFNEGKVVLEDMKKWLLELFGYLFKTVDRLIKMKLNKSEPEYYYF